MAQYQDFDKELNLSVSNNFKSILVDVDLSPKNASCLIYGVMADGKTEAVSVKGGHSQVKLPFSNGKIYLKYADGATEVRIGTIGIHK